MRLNTLYKCLFLLPALGFAGTALGQNLAAYSDNLNNFYLFEAGNEFREEHQEIRNFAVGGTYLVWNDNTGNFKVRDHGRTIKLQDGFVEEYNISNYLITYRMGEQLKVYDDKGKRTLDNGVTHYFDGDSIVVWYDRFVQQFKGYYNGEIVVLEDGLVRTPVTKAKVADNIAAWMNPRNYLMVWYQGEVFELLYGVSGVQFKVGRNLIAWTTATYQDFNVLYKNEEFLLGEVPPRSFETGDNIVAYVDNVGAFQVFYKGEIEEVSSFEPQWYKVQDNIVLYAEQDMLKVYYQGEITELETFVPTDYQMLNGNVVWRDLTNRLKGFINGKEVTISNEQVNSYLLGYQTVQFHLGVNQNKVWWEGKVY